MRSCLTAFPLACLLACVSAITNDQLYPYGSSDDILPKGSEVESPLVELNVPIVFYSETYPNLYVNNKGVISFRADIATFLNMEFPLPYPSISAFYTNIDTTLSGTVYYRESDDQRALLKATEAVLNNFPEYTDFSPKSVFIATWERVGYYKEHADKVNTFQIAIISSGNESFVQLLYPEDGIQWLQSDAETPGIPVATAQAGFVGEDVRFFNLKGSGTHQIRNLVTWSNTNEPGVFIFRVGQVDNNIVLPDQYELNLREEDDTMTCQQAGKTCHMNARCIDYDTGFCCRCQDGYYGNGRNCIKTDVPIRVNGKVSGEINRVQLENVVLQAYVIINEGRVYTALSSVPDSIGYNLQTLNVLGGVIGWLFAQPMDTAQNGYQLTSAIFNHTAEINYPITGDRVVITQEYLGHDVFDDISLEATITGTIPPVTGKLDITEYDEQFTLTSPGLISSFSKRTFKNHYDNSIYEEVIKQTFKFDYCRHEPEVEAYKVPSTMKVAKNFLTFENKIVRFGMSNKLYPINRDDPCLRGRDTCVPNSSCVVYENTFKCVCNAGYQNYNGSESNACVDVDECFFGEHRCDPSATCINEEGSYRCECNPGLEGDGFTCTSPNTKTGCDSLRCDYNSHCEELTPGFPDCVCDGDFIRSGDHCVDAGGCDTQNNCPENSYCNQTPDGTYACECLQGYTKDSYGNCQADLAETTTENYYPREDKDMPEPTCGFLGACYCPEGYEAYTDDQTSLDKCRLKTDATTDDYGASCTSNNQCPNNAQCEYSSKTGKRECHCDFGFISVDDECVKDPFCSSDKDCDVNAQCKYNENSSNFECICREGFKRDQFGTCVTDLCNNAICVPHATCVWDNSAGVDFCQCDEGYIGDGVYSCVINGTSCEEANNCGENAVCKNSEYTGEVFCACIDGYSGDGTICTPDPTCLNDPNMCSPHASCISKKDGYMCECNSGFLGNGTECRPKPKPPGNFLLLAYGIFLYKVPMVPTLRDTPAPIQSDSEQIAIGIDIDCPNGRVFWSDYYNKAIKSCNYDGTEIETFLSEDIVSPEGLTVDWVSRNIFWTDSKKFTIEVASMDTKQRRVLIQGDLKNPRGIAVHPQRGKLFWSDWNRQNPKIEWSNLDGSERSVFVSNGDIGLPNSLSIDWLSDSLCYADAGTKKINCISIDSKETVTQASNCTYPFGLGISNNNFYWTDWQTNKIEVLNRRTNIRSSIAVGTAGDKLYSIVAVPEQCPQLYNVCQYQNGNCLPQTLCLLDGNGSRTCV